MYEHEEVRLEYKEEINFGIGVDTQNCCAILTTIKDKQENLMSEDFNENYEEFSKEDDMLFCRDMLLAQASDLQDAYRYIHDFSRQHPSETLTTVLEYVRLCIIGLEQAYQVLDDKLFDNSEGKDYNWVPNKD